MFDENTQKILDDLRNKFLNLPEDKQKSLLNLLKPKNKKEDEDNASN